MSPPGTENGVSSLGTYTVKEEPFGKPRHLRVVAVGGGATGLNIARHMELYMQNYELQIYEKNSDIGGTWFENR
jgi:cation diffusion facilitator CzcD-associated flavoprotein CzcO